MGKQVIKNRFSGLVIFECECGNISACLKLAVNARANLLGADLSRANLLGADLSRADLSRANLLGANLLGANLLGANLLGANLSRANLSEANLSRANLSRADLSRANLSEANLFGANLSRANLLGANLSEANLSEANLFGAKSILSVNWMGFSLYIQAEKTKIGCEYRTNKEWLKMDIDFAVNLGIKREHFEIYRSLLRCGVKTLKSLDK